MQLNTTLLSSNPKALKYFQFLQRHTLPCMSDCGYTRLLWAFFKLSDPHTLFTQHRSTHICDEADVGFGGILLARCLISCCEISKELHTSRQGGRTWHASGNHNYFWNLSPKCLRIFPKSFKALC